MTQRQNRHEAFSEIVTQNEEMLSIFKDIESISRSTQAVLITGETGVGKELVARAIHFLSDVSGNFITVNVAGLDDNMFSDSLFGHAKGAFTGADQARGGLIERAVGGTLFLDEIGDLIPMSQIKLLRLLQEGEYLPLGSDEHKKTCARVVVATNQNLWELQRAGKFREDLNFRMRTHHIHLPPLRERPDDLPLLLNHFLGEAARDLKVDPPTLPKGLIGVLEAYPFPGNVRELRSMVYDVVSKGMSGKVTLDVFKSYMVHGETRRVDSIEPEETPAVTFSKKLPSLKEAANLLVAEAMKRAKGNQSIAAEMLGISQPALSKRIKKQKTH